MCKKKVARPLQAKRGNELGVVIKEEPETAQIPAESAAAGDAKTHVVRLRRAGGVVVQGCDVYIGRAWNAGGWALPQSVWANPFTVRNSGSAAAAVARYREYVLGRPDLLARLGELRGRTLGCWCTPGPATATSLSTSWSSARSRPARTRQRGRLAKSRASESWMWRHITGWPRRRERCPGYA